MKFNIQPETSPYESYDNFHELIASQLKQVEAWSDVTFPAQLSPVAKHANEDVQTQYQTSINPRADSETIEQWAIEYATQLPNFQLNIDTRPKVSPRRDAVVEPTSRKTSVRILKPKTTYPSSPRTEKTRRELLTVWFEIHRFNKKVVNHVRRKNRKNLHQALDKWRTQTAAKVSCNCLESEFELLRMHNAIAIWHCWSHNNSVHHNQVVLASNHFDEVLLKKTFSVLKVWYNVQFTKRRELFCSIFKHWKAMTYFHVVYGKHLCKSYFQALHHFTKFKSSLFERQFSFRLDYRRRHYLHQWYSLIASKEKNAKTAILLHRNYLRRFYRQWRCLYVLRQYLRNTQKRILRFAFLSWYREHHRNFLHHQKMRGLTFRAWRGVIHRKIYDSRMAQTLASIRKRYVINKLAKHVSKQEQLRSLFHQADMFQKRRQVQQWYHITILQQTRREIITELHLVRLHEGIARWRSRAKRSNRFRPVIQIIRRSIEKYFYELGWRTLHAYFKHRQQHRATRINANDYYFHRQLQFGISTWFQFIQDRRLLREHHLQAVNWRYTRATHQHFHKWRTIVNSIHLRNLKWKKCLVHHRQVLLSTSLRVWMLLIKYFRFKDAQEVQRQLQAFCLWQKFGVFRSKVNEVSHSAERLQRIQYFRRWRTLYQHHTKLKDLEKDFRQKKLEHLVRRVLKAIQVYASHCREVNATSRQYRHVTHLRMKDQIWTKWRSLYLFRQALAFFSQTLDRHAQWKSLRKLWRYHQEKKLQRHQVLEFQLQHPLHLLSKYRECFDMWKLYLEQKYQQLLAATHWNHTYLLRQCFRQWLYRLKRRQYFQGWKKFTVKEKLKSVELLRLMKEFQTKLFTRQQLQALICWEAWVQAWKSERTALRLCKYQTSQETRRVAQACHHYKATLLRKCSRAWKHLLEVKYAMADEFFCDHHFERHWRQWKQAHRQQKCEALRNKLLLKYHQHQPAAVERVQEGRRDHPQGGYQSAFYRRKAYQVQQAKKKKKRERLKQKAPSQLEEAAALTLVSQNDLGQQQIVQQDDDHEAIPDDEHSSTPSELSAASSDPEYNASSKTTWSLRVLFDSTCVYYTNLTVEPPLNNACPISGRGRDALRVYTCVRDFDLLDDDFFFEEAKLVIEKKLDDFSRETNQVEENDDDEKVDAPTEMSLFYAALENIALRKRKLQGESSKCFSFFKQYSRIDQRNLQELLVNYPELYHMFLQHMAPRLVNASDESGWKVSPSMELPIPIRLEDWIVHKLPPEMYEPAFIQCSQTYRKELHKLFTFYRQTHGFQDSRQKFMFKAFAGLMKDANLSPKYFTRKQLVHLYFITQHRKQMRASPPSLAYENPNVTLKALNFPELIELLARVALHLYSGNVLNLPSLHLKFRMLLFAIENASTAFIFKGNRQLVLKVLRHCHITQQHKRSKPLDEHSRREKINKYNKIEMKKKQIEHGQTASRNKRPSPTTSSSKALGKGEIPPGFQVFPIDRVYRGKKREAFAPTRKKVEAASAMAPDGSMASLSSAFPLPKALKEKRKQIQKREQIYATSFSQMFPTIRRTAPHEYTSIPEIEDEEQALAMMEEFIQQSKSLSPNTEIVVEDPFLRDITNPQAVFNDDKDATSIGSSNISIGSDVVLETPDLDYWTSRYLE